MRVWWGVAGALAGPAGASCVRDLRRPRGPVGGAFDLRAPVVFRASGVRSPKVSEPECRGMRMVSPEVGLLGDRKLID